MAQITGPFNAGQIIFDGSIGNSNANNWSGLPQDSFSNYIILHIGIQAPQTPYITEVDKLEDMNYIYGTGIDQKPSGLSAHKFRINANEILEFDDLERTMNNFTLYAGSDLDAYTIIDIGFIEK